MLLKNSTQQKEGIYMYSMIGFKSFISCRFMIMYFHVSGFFETFSYPLAIFFPVHVSTCTCIAGTIYISLRFSFAGELYIHSKGLKYYESYNIITII